MDRPGPLIHEHVNKTTAILTENELSESIFSAIGLHSFPFVNDIWLKRNWKWNLLYGSDRLHISVDFSHYIIFIETQWNCISLSILSFLWPFYQLRRILAKDLKISSSAFIAQMAAFRWAHEEECSQSCGASHASTCSRPAKSFAGEGSSAAGVLLCECRCQRSTARYRRPTVERAHISTRCVPHCRRAV